MKGREEKKREESQALVKGGGGNFGGYSNGLENLNFLAVLL